MRGLFVTGTDTEAGKTIVTAAIVAGLMAAGVRVAAFKPVVTGLDDPAPAPWPRDHELLATLTGVPPSDVAPLTFGPAVSPHLAAELAGVRIEPAELLAAARRAAADADALVVEGVGGLLVPLTTGYAIRDFAVDLELGVIVAARPGLGTINHTLLTLEAARSAGLTVRAVVITPWPSASEPIHQSNRATIERLGAVEVVTLPPLDGPGEQLAAAGAELRPLRWIASGP
jgi:dethiobiotin synthetase